MGVPGATRIERAAATPTARRAIQIIAHAHAMSASAAQRDHFVEFIFAPNRGRMFCNLVMTEMARKPAPTAFEFQRDDVGCAVIMRAARFRVDIDAANLEPVDRSSHAATRWRGHSNTRADAMIQQTIIITT